MKRNTSNIPWLVVFIYLVLIGLSITGYIKDIKHLIDCDFKPTYKAEILYGIGAVTGLGAIFGWIDFGK